MAAQDDVEARVSEQLRALERDFAHLGAEMRATLTRALIHRAVHYATEAPGVEFCALATYLGDMVGHAHRLAHGDNPKAPSHGDRLH